MRQLMKQKQKDFLGKITLAIAGMLIFSAGINFFIVPADLYKRRHAWNQPADPDSSGQISSFIFRLHRHCRYH